MMRRSKAPSQKLYTVSNPRSGIKEFTSSQPDGDTGLKPRSAASILDILNTNFVDKPTEKENLIDEDNLLNSDNSDECKSLDDNEKTALGFSRPAEEIQAALSHEHSINNNIRKFNVVYGKQSKKKHKTWEGDGILELLGNSVTLKDSDGKVLGRASGKKFADLEEGAQLFIGSKEIEIIDEVKVQSNELERKRLLDQSDDCQVAEQIPAKKIKKISASNKMAFNSPLVSNIVSVKPLVMPRPDHEHQWKFNSNNAKIHDVVVDARLTSKLRPHQRDGVTFLYSCIVGLKNHKYTGAILADEMGLGKTLQTITLLWTLMKQGPYGIPLIQRVLIVTPSSLVGNWNQEFIRWLGKERILTFIVDQKNKPCDYLKLPKIPVIMISYEMFVRYHEDISQIKFDLIVCDEGHRLKNNNIRTSLLLSQLECRRRIILTGTPIQNDLQEFHSLIDFVNPGILGSYAEFKRNFEEPIVKSRQPDVGEYILKKGEGKAQELNFKTSGFILRRTQALVNQYLPAKYETVVFCKPTNLQKLCYKKAAEFWESRLDPSDSETSPVSHLSVMIAMKKISNHPLLVYDSNREEPDDLTLCLSDLLESSCSNFILEDSSKLIVVNYLLQNLNKTNEKLVLVSYYTQTLDMLADLCKNLGFKFCRLDGATPSAQRIAIVNKFNSKNSPDSVFLLSGKAGGTGLNLVGASRLVLFDSDWNPASDLQAMARIWRDGQTNSVFIYRLLNAGTIEEKIFQRQLSKASLSETVVDIVASNSTVRLSRDELKDLFTVHDSPCLTHDLMECSCSGGGEILIPQDEESNKSESQNDYQLSIEAESSADSKPNLRMNQLFQWEHHASPFNSTLLKEMALNGADESISFLFRNIISKQL